jgi:hypothetical protein
MMGVIRLLGGALGPEELGPEELSRWEECTRRMGGRDGRGSRGGGNGRRVVSGARVDEGSPPRWVADSSSSQSKLEAAKPVAESSDFNTFVT